MDIAELKKYRHVQRIAKKVLSTVSEYINSNSTEISIVQQCIDLLKDNGIDKTWYYDVPAFVLLGSRSNLSLSGRNYIPNDEKCGRLNLITIDLSPLIDNIWGDCARSFVLENGKVTKNPKDKEFIAGLEAEQILHTIFKEIVNPDSYFEEVFYKLNDVIKNLGYENLDFLGNLGHSITQNKNDRIYFEKGNHKKLNDVQLFTFEPHIRMINGKWGFKHENIYFFNSDGFVEEL